MLDESITVTTSTAATTAVATSTSATTVTAATTRAIFRWLGFVHGQRTAAGHFPIQPSNRCGSFLVVAHLDEPETFGPAGVPVDDELTRLHFAKGREQVTEGG